MNWVHKFKGCLPDSLLICFFNPVSFEKLTKLHRWPWESGASKTVHGDVWVIKWPRIKARMLSCGAMPLKLGSLSFLSAFLWSAQCKTPSVCPERIIVSVYKCLPSVTAGILGSFPHALSVMSPQLPCVGHFWHPTRTWRHRHGLCLNCKWLEPSPHTEHTAHPRHLKEARSRNSENLFLCLSLIFSFSDEIYYLYIYTFIW